MCPSKSIDLVLDLSFCVLDGPILRCLKHLCFLDVLNFSMALPIQNHVKAMCRYVCGYACRYACRWVGMDVGMLVCMQQRQFIKARHKQKHNKSIDEPMCPSKSIDPVLDQGSPGSPARLVGPSKCVGMCVSMWVSM